MTLPLGWINHLLATNSAVNDSLNKVRRLAMDGISLGGTGGQPLAPLPAAEWRVLRSELNAVRVEMDSLLESLAPQESALEKEVRLVSVTRRQILLALAMLEEEQIDDIDPSLNNHYGPLEDDDRERLINAAASMRKRLQALRHAIAQE